MLYGDESMRAHVLLFAISTEISTIVVPIHTTLAPLVPLIETQVPRTFDRSREQSGFTVDSIVVRDPIQLRMSGTVLYASTVARYSLKACRGRFCISCGIDEPLREANIALSAQFVWDGTWRLRSTTLAEPVTFPNRCELSFFNFDITDRFIAPLVDAQLRGLADAIDHNSPGITNIRPKAEQIWSALQVPAEVAPRTWLVFEPIDAGLAPLTGQDLALSSTLSVNARTRVIVGDKPEVAITPLPALLTRESGGGLRVPFDIHLGYEDATALANEQFGHRHYKIGDDDLHIETLALAPAANGRLAVDAMIRFKGYEGPVHLEGTPRVDVKTNSVTVPDLDYALDAAHRTLFQRVVEGVAHDLIRARLRDSATIPFAKHAAALREEINKGLTRQASPNTQISGRADEVRPESVVAEPDGMVVRVLVTGSAEVAVSGW
jgi:hypothetical protein